MYIRFPVLHRAVKRVSSKVSQIGMGRPTPIPAHEGAPSKLRLGGDVPALLTAALDGTEKDRRAPTQAKTGLEWATRRECHTGAGIEIAHAQAATSSAARALCGGPT